MKMKAVVKSKGVEQKVSIEIRVEAGKYILRREELSRWKRKLQNSVHRILIEDGYDAASLVVK